MSNPSTTHPRVAVNVRDEILIELALRGGKVPPQVIQKGKTVLEEMSRFGITRGMFAVLVERKLVEREVERELVQELARLETRCPRCRGGASLAEIRPEGTVRCSRCEAPLSLELEPADRNRPRRLEDRLRVKPGALPEGASAPPLPLRRGSVQKELPPAPAPPRPPPREKTRPAPAPAPAPAAAPPPEPAKPARTTIHRYRLGPVVSSGPLGRLYRGAPVREKGPGLPAAIKVLASDLKPSSRSVAELRERLRAWTAQRPALPHTLEEEDELLYLVRPFLDEHWTTLSDREVKEGKALLLRAAAQALKTVHEAGMVHGNLKPSNVLVQRGGERAELVDPALRLLYPADPVARLRCLAAAPRFVSPEEIAGEQASAASDVYALGWTFFTVLTGQPPFAGVAAPEVLRRHREGPCPALPGAAGEWRRLVEAMTAVAPMQRPASGAVVLACVERILAGKKLTLAPVTPRAGAPARQGPPPSTSHFPLRYALGPAFLLLIALPWTGWSFWTWQQARTVFAEENRLDILLDSLSLDAFQKAHAEARERPHEARTVWQEYLQTFGDLPQAEAARRELERLSPVQVRPLPSPPVNAPGNPPGTPHGNPPGNPPVNPPAKQPGKQPGK